MTCHALGLMDFYDTDYDGSGGESEGLGAWDIMSGGNYNGGGAYPASHNSFSKYLMGWQLLGLIQGDGTYMLPAIELDTLAGYYEVFGTNEFFMLENRQLISFDSELPNHGLLIYHVDYDLIAASWESNSINVDPYHLGMDIEEADYETSDVYGDTYPGSSSNTSFTDYTYPNSIPWYESYTGRPITSITESGTDVYFNISGFTNINDVTNKNNVKVFPTIANDQIEIQSSEIILEISLINLQGQTLVENKVSDLKTTFNVSGIEQGTYYIKVKTSNQVTIHKVIVIH